MYFSFWCAYLGPLRFFHLEFERWEQPHIEEMKNVSPDVVEKAMDTFLAQNTPTQVCAFNAFCFVILSIDIHLHGEENKYW